MRVSGEALDEKSRLESHRVSCSPLTHHIVTKDEKWSSTLVYTNGFSLTHTQDTHTQTHLG